MIHRLNTYDALKINEDWTGVQLMDISEAIVARDCENDSRPRIYWRVLNLNNVTDEVLEPELKSSGGLFLFDSKRSELIHADLKGIVAYNLVSHESRLLYDIDLACGLERNEKFVIENKAQFSPDKNAIVFLQIRTVRKTTLSGEPKSGRSGKTMEGDTGLGTFLYKDAKLIKLNLETSQWHEIVHLPEAPVSWDIEWERNKFFACCMNRLIEVDLRAQRIQILDERFGNYHIALSPNGTLLVWKPIGAGIEERASGGRKNEVAKQGRFPAVSPDGSKIAFINHSNEFWLKEGGSTPKLIASSKKTNSLRYETPSWCFCGDHVAVSLVASPSQQILIIADIPRRNLIPFMSEPLPTGDHVWIDKTTGDMLGWNRRYGEKNKGE